MLESENTTWGEELVMYSQQTSDRMPVILLVWIQLAHVISLCLSCLTMRIRVETVAKVFTERQHTEEKEEDAFLHTCHRAVLAKDDKRGSMSLYLSLSRSLRRANRRTTFVHSYCAAVQLGTLRRTAEILSKFKLFVTTST